MLAGGKEGEGLCPLDITIVNFHKVTSGVELFKASLDQCFKNFAKINKKEEYYCTSLPN